MTLSPDLVSSLSSACMARKGKPERGEIRFCCPAHDDEHPSARWNADKGTWICDACKTGGGGVDLAKRLEIPLPKNGNGHVIKQRVVDTFDYGDYVIERLEPGKTKPKDFRPRRPNGAGGWIYDCPQELRTLYRLKDALALADPIVIPEGERKADELLKLGIAATAYGFGGLAWTDHYRDLIPRDREVVLMPDRDDAGQKAAAKIAESFKQAGREVRVAVLPGDGNDVVDFLKAGGTEKEIREAIEDAKPWAPEPESRIEVVSGAELLAEPDEERCSHFTERFYYPAFGASCGGPRSGKGTDHLWFAFCLSMGMDLGHGVECVKRAPTMFFTNEDTRRRLRRRLRDMARGAGVAFEDIKDLHLIAKPKPALHLPENLDALKRALDPIGPKFIVIDGLSRISTGRDLNSDEEMQPVVEALETIRDDYVAALELICHNTKAAEGKGTYKVKGAGAVGAAADHLLFFEREGDTSALTFSDSRDDDDWKMSLTERWNETGDGVVYELKEKHPDISSIVKQAAPTKRVNTRDRIAAEIIRLHAEKKDGVSKEDLVEKLKLGVDSIYKHTRDLEMMKHIRTVVTPGKPTLYYPPLPPPEVKP